MTFADQSYLPRILGDLDRYLVERLDPLLKSMGLGREHWQVLRLLDDGEGRSMGDIARLTGLPRASATRVVDLLTANALVYRRSDPFDRRRVLVYLAEPGAESLRRIERALITHAGPALTVFGADERGKLAEFVGRLLKVQTS